MSKRKSPSSSASRNGDSVASKADTLSRRSTKKPDPAGGTAGFETIEIDIPAEQASLSTSSELAAFLNKSLAKYYARLKKQKAAVKTSSSTKPARATPSRTRKSTAKTPAVDTDQPAEAT
jgi:hypothetical protein